MNSTQLIYNPSNESLFNRAEIDAMPVPAALGPRHNPYPFGAYLNDVEESLDLNGLEILRQEYAIDHDGQRLFGLMEVAPLEGELITAKDWSLLIGVRGSHDQRISRGLTLGSRVMVCSNLCFHGDLGTFHTKQTLNIASRLPALIRGAVERIPELAHQQEARFNTYKAHEFGSPRHGDAALIEIMRRGGLTGAQLAKAVQQWDNPDHDDHAAYGWSMWRLLNACTEAVKPGGANVNMATIQDRTQKTTSFLDEVAGISY